MMNTDRKDLPSYELEAYRAQKDDLKLCRDVCMGTSRLRKEQQAYLPQHPAELRDDYGDRLDRSVLYNAFRSTKRGLAGMVFRRDPVLDMENEAPIPPKLEADLQDADLRGNAWDVFAREVFEDALEAGHCAILVDAPDGEPATTARDEAALGRRPYWVHVPKEGVINWREERIDGRAMLVQATIKTEIMEPDGEFGEQAVCQYRVFQRGDPVTWQLWESRDEKDPVKVGEGTIANVTEIPLVAVNVSDTGFVSDPPLLDLAHTNIAHYQVLSDHLTALHKASVPVGVATGINPDKPVPVGPNTILKLPEGATFTYAEHGGKALAATRQQMQDFETQMARQGMAQIQHETRAAETAEAKRIDKAEQDSTLSAAARAVEDALNRCIELHCEMKGIDNVPTIHLNRDFERLMLDAQQVQVYGDMVAKGQLSIETLWKILAEGGVLPDGFDGKLERAMLEAEAMSFAGPQPVVPDEDEDEDDE